MVLTRYRMLLVLSFSADTSGWFNSFIWFEILYLLTLSEKHKRKLRFTIVRNPTPQKKEAGDLISFLVALRLPRVCFLFFRLKFTLLGVFFPGWEVGGGGNQALSLSRRGLFHSAGFGSSAGTFLSGLGLFHTRILSFTATCCPLGSYLRGPSRRRTEPVCRRGLRHRAEKASKTGGNDSSVQREPRSASRTVGTLRFHSTTLPLSTLITTHYGGLTRTSPPPLLP